MSDEGRTQPEPQDGPENEAAQQPAQPSEPSGGVTTVPETTVTGEPGTTDDEDERPAGK